MKEATRRAPHWPRVGVPVHPFARALLLRSIVLWVGGRCMLVWVSRSWESAFSSLPGSLLIIAAVGFLAMLDARRRNETVFLANLGVARWTIAAFAVVPAAVLELLVAVVHRFIITGS